MKSGHPRYGKALEASRAEQSFRQGMKFMQAHDWVSAIQALRRATHARPEDAAFWLALAQAYRKVTDAVQAEACARRALELQPGMTVAARLLADLLIQQGRHSQAAEILVAATSPSETDPEIFLEAAQAFEKARRFLDAIDQYGKALQRRPHALIGHVGLGNCLDGLGAVEAAYECYRTASLLEPGNSYVLTCLVHEALHAARWESLSEEIQALRAAWRGGSHSTRPFQMLSIPGLTAAEHRQAAAAFAADYRPGGEPLPPLPRQRRPGRIRVGYLSSEFMHHATSLLLADVLTGHDRERFEVTCYCYAVPDESPIRKRLREEVEHFVEMREMSVRTMAERIRADGIDILVDLKGYTYATRSMVCSLRPAPIQVNYLGYPGTMGSGAFDYIVTDPVVTPLEAAADYDEKFAYMPDCYQPNMRWQPLEMAQTRAQAGLPQDAFVFCCFNNLYKITPEVFDVWCSLLRAVPSSVMWLLETNMEGRKNLLQAARDRGVDPARFIFAEFVPAHLNVRRLQLADLVLDTLPYNAHTTGSDALRAGVPIVTAPGQTFASRVAASLLQAVGIHETIAGSLQEYERIALRLATHPAELQRLRTRLGVALRSGHAPLFDCDRYARNLEGLYQRMFDRWQSGAKPAHLMPQAQAAGDAVGRDETHAQALPV